MPQTYLGTVPPDRLKARRNLVRHWTKVAHLVWGKTGDGKVALVLLERFWSGKDPWVTADYVAATLENIYSDDTVRRRLKHLVNTDVVLTRREGRLTLYAMRPSVAEELIEAMEPESDANCEQNMTSSRNLRENLVVVGPYETHRKPQTHDEL